MIDVTITIIASAHPDFIQIATPSGLRAKPSLGVPNFPMLLFEVFGKETIDLEEALAGEDHFAIVDFQVAGSLLVREGFGKLFERVDSEFFDEGFGGHAAFLHLEDPFANEPLVVGWDQGAIYG